MFLKAANQRVDSDTLCRRFAPPSLAVHARPRTTTFREIDARDVPELFEIRTSTRENRMTMQALGSIGITPDSTVKALSVSVAGWLCEVSGKIVDFSMRNKNTGEMLVVAVLPEYENRGIGKRLMALIQEWLFAQGHEEIWLLENPDPQVRAYGFYRKLGWVAARFHDSGQQILKLSTPRGW